MSGTDIALVAHVLYLFHSWIRVGFDRSGRLQPPNQTRHS